ncbi:MAG TPA: hypothetical protein VJM74_03685 [Nitrososphaeraceae archaeon]|nr:hypothetical protein [Nitrososphaeraceae archaeon]
MAEKEVERIMKYLVEEGTVVKLLRVLETEKKYTHYNIDEENCGLSHYSRKYKAWVLRNECIRLN